MWRPFNQNDRTTWPVHSDFVLIHLKGNPPTLQLAKFEDERWELNHTMYGAADINPNVTEWCEVPLKS